MNIPLFKNYWDKKDIEYISKVIKRGMYWAIGPEVAEFEKNLAVLVGTKYCVTFNSGTSALHAVLAALAVREQEVIVPAFTFISTANSVLMAGGKPVFADIEDQTFGLEVEDVKEKITAKTKAIMPVHYGGCSCEIKALRELAEDHKLLLVEDAAESLGAKFDDRMVGTFGDAAMFSFTPTKIISTGEGGVIVTDNKDLFEKLKLIRSHGRLETADYFSSTQYMDYITLGYNFRIPSVCAAQGLAQLEKIGFLIQQRRKVAQDYDSGLGTISKIRTPIAPNNRFHIYQMYSILINDGKIERDRLQEHLKKNGISSRVYFEPIYNSYFYNKELKFNTKLKRTEEIADKILSIPIYPGLKRNEIKYIISKITEYFN